MSQLIKKIRTDAGDLQIDYTSLANLPTISNPNLLINSDFRNPINQRSKTKYIGSTDRVYTIDRWYLDTNNSGRTMEVVNDGILITNTDATYSASFKQTFETSLPAGDYTLTAKVTAKTGRVFMRCDGSRVDTRKELEVGINTLTLTSATINSFSFLLYESASVTLEWAKLEIGTTSTPFSPRPYGEEVMLCKRFFQNVNLYWRPGVVNSAGTVISFAVDVPLRTLQTGSPLVTFYQVPTRIRTTSSNSVDTTLTLQSSSVENGVLVLNIASSTNLEARSIALVVDEFKMNIDAEIY